MASIGVTGAPAALAGVGKRFGRRGAWVLEEIDWEVAPGSITVVQGDNASGKTTLLRIVAGVTRPTVGHVDRTGATVGFVPERLPMRIRMTATEYCVHLGRVRGLDATGAHARGAALFDRLGLEPGPDARIASLSKGNVQKVVLAQALLGEPALLVLDEPYNGLDVPAHEALTALLAEARDRAAAVLVTAHGEHDVPGADRVLRLRNGTLVDAGRATDGPPVARVELRTNGDAPQSALVARSGARVLERDPAGRRLVLAVPATEVDALLLHALTSGWSVLQVAPDSSPGSDRRNPG
jgi:ABC-type multidrug transport system ATPase subunit